MCSTHGRIVALVTIALALPACASSPRGADGNGPTVDLPDLARRGELVASGRNVSAFTEAGGEGVRLSASMGDGIAWIEGLEMATGTIEIDLRGQDVPQGSFVGVAFGGVDAERYEAVYLRPFNFRAPDPARRSRSVQYIAHPEHTWQQLRSDHPGVYESAVEPAPAAADWVTMRLVIDPSTVRVHLGDATAPMLTVARLADGQGRRVGLWVGNNSPGDFANLRVMPR